MRTISIETWKVSERKFFGFLLPTIVRFSLIILVIFDQLDKMPRSPRKPEREGRTYGPVGSQRPSSYQLFIPAVGFTMNLLSVFNFCSVADYLAVQREGFGVTQFSSCPRHDRAP